VGCTGCTCLSCVCQADPRCCAEQWSAACVTLCTDSCGQSCP
jgi:hypothetical protein